MQSTWQASFVVRKYPFWWSLLSPLEIELSEKVPEQTYLNSKHILSLAGGTLLCPDERIILVTCQPLLVYSPGKLSDVYSVDRVMQLILLAVL